MCCVFDGVRLDDRLRFQRTGEVQCERGYHCIDGVKAPCAAGRYGSEPGLSTAECSALCEAGFVCSTAAKAPNSDHPQAGVEVTECGSASVFCAQGSASPVLVRDGYFSTPVDAAPERRTGEEVCPAGSACLAGIQQLCEAGKFGQDIGQSKCTDLCGPGR